ncbi:DUF2784 domain-containing protein [Lacimicrobium alkaliphilum]|uniref:DUF2784 domain-containing protein n=1 Tax=Lacimicrobium alkaliphilum TaxID=1526571 RepID=A0A0U2Z8K3_9ALTE|nr:DUF2784 domain-containing protein [Lacimicrobium alkaliphilum]ALS98788.1 hypothetical protein AT746_11240 [Lacimicrobium alkaliphilum]
MNQQQLYLLGADLLLGLHLAFVLFVVGGLLLIFIGKWQRWIWVRNRRFRFAHLLAIGFVVIQAWLGRICPLTQWEMMLREQAGQVTYSGAFIAHWMSELLYYQAPAWVFILIYSLFGLLVLLSWYWIKPHKKG